MKQEHNNQIPESFYQTGNTESGKSHRGLYLTLIVLVILLVGVVSVMGLLNIQLFRRVQELSPDDHVFQIARISEPEPAVLPDSTPQGRNQKILCKSISIRHRLPLPTFPKKAVYHCRIFIRVIAAASFLLQPVTVVTAVWSSPPAVTF